MKRSSVILSSVLIASLMLTGCGGKKNYEVALEHFSDGNYNKAAHFFAKSNGYKDSDYFLTDYTRTTKTFIGDADNSLSIVNGKLVGTGFYKDYIEYYEDFAALAQRDDIVALSGESYVMALCSDGTVATAGFYSYDEEYKAEIESWENIKYIYCGGFVQLGIQENGVVRYTGSRAEDFNMSFWTDMVKIVGDSSLHLAGLNVDGKIWIATLDAVTSDNFEGWHEVRDVIDIEMTDSHTLVMLKKDGTIQLLNANAETVKQVQNWKDIKDIAVCGGYIHGVTYDGKILSTNYDTLKNAEKLKNIVSVENQSVNNGSIIATDRDGNVYLVSGWSNEKTEKLKNIKLFINKNY